MRGLVWETAEELDLKIAQRVRDIRKRRSISQKRLSGMSGVSYGSIKRFETTGQNIFTQIPYRDIQEVINESR